MPENERIIYKDENIPAIISEELWDKANAVYNERRNVKNKNVINISEIKDRKKLPAENTLAGELNKKITDAIHNLPEPFRIAIVLRELQGLSYEEISDITQTSIGTIKSRIARARTKLQESLKPYLIQ